MEIRRRRRLPATLSGKKKLTFSLSSRTLSLAPLKTQKPRKPLGDGSLAHLDASEAEALSSGSIATPIPLPEGLHEVGREQPAELVLPVPTVSARHARLSVSPLSVSVVDLGSTNGTYLDGNPLEPMAEVAVGVGQEVVFGDQFLAKYRLDREEE